MAPIIKRCRLERMSFLLTHSHPFTRHGVSFSAIDDGGERQLMPKVQERAPGLPHGTIVFGQESLDARLWFPDKGTSEVVDFVRVVGDGLAEIQPTSTRDIVGAASSWDREVYARQILVFGETGQERLARMTVGIIGAGGTGSQTFQQLAHLGVGRIIVVDDDVVEKSNRSRLVGSISSDVAGQPMPKVLVMQRLGNDINPRLTVVPIRGSVLRHSVALQLRDVDVLFCCTDNLRSRALLNRLSFQHLIPLIDMGIDIQADAESKVRKIGGRVTVVLPDGPCLACLGVLSSEILTAKAAGLHHAYITSEQVQAPAVISLNGVVASLAVTEFLKLVHGLCAEGELRRYQMLDALEGWVRTYLMQPVNECHLCADLKGRGDSLPLPCNVDDA